MVMKNMIYPVIFLCVHWELIGKMFIFLPQVTVFELKQIQSAPHWHTKNAHF